MLKVMGLFTFIQFVNIKQRRKNEVGRREKIYKATLKLAISNFKSIQATMT